MEEAAAADFPGLAAVSEARNALPGAAVAGGLPTEPSVRSGCVTSPGWREARQLFDSSLSALASGSSAQPSRK